MIIRKVSKKKYDEMKAFYESELLRLHNLIKQLKQENIDLLKNAIEQAHKKSELAEKLKNITDKI